MLNSLTESSIIKFKFLGLEKSEAADNAELMGLREKALEILKDEEDMPTFMVTRLDQFFFCLTLIRQVKGFPRPWFKS